MNELGPYEQEHGPYQLPSITLKKHARVMPIRQLEPGTQTLLMPDAGGLLADYLYWKADPAWLESFLGRLLTYYGKDIGNGEEDSVRGTVHRVR